MRREGLRPVSEDGAEPDWWRRRESNPRPQALCRRFYMRSLSFDLTGGSPDRQGDLPAIPKGFSGLAPGGPRRDLMRYDAQNLNASARLQLDGTLPGFKRRVRSCRRWQLCFLQLDLRGPLPLGMPLRFRDPRRNQVAPFGSQVTAYGDFPLLPIEEMGLSARLFKRHAMRALKA